MTNDESDFMFETDHSQYASLAHERSEYIPFSLELRAKAALAELADIHREFELYMSQYDEEEKKREDAFDDAMSHFQDTKDKWVRHEDPEGNIHWVDVSYLGEPEKPLPFWPFGDTSEWY